MSRSRSKKSKSNQLPLFIEKLMEMLEDSTIDTIISWTSSNDSFHIKSITQFTQTILPKYFKHNNFSSFIRQLNMYGFRKIRHDEGQNVYQNQFFRKGNRSGLKNIKRKINQQKDDKLAVYNEQPVYTVTKQIQQMKNKQKDLQQICRHLLLQNKKLIDQNNGLMRRMKDESRSKQRKIQQLLLAFVSQGQNSSNFMIQQNDSTSNLLSIMSSQNHTDLGMLNEKTQDTPLQVITNALTRNKNMKQFRQMLESYYGENPKGNPSSNGQNARLTRRRSQNFTENGLQNPCIGLGEKGFITSPIKEKNNQSRELLMSNKKQKQQKMYLNQNQQSLFNMHDDDSSLLHLGNSVDIHDFLSNSQFQIRPSLRNDNNDNYFLSINDFMNLDDQGPQLNESINLQESI